MRNGGGGRRSPERARIVHLHSTSALLARPGRHDNARPLTLPCPPPVGIKEFGARGEEPTDPGPRGKGASGTKSAGFLSSESRLEGLELRVHLNERRESMQ